MRSYTVAICENETVQALLLEKVLEEYAAEQDIHFRVSIFESAEAFLFQYEEEKNVDLILLDIQMNEMDGLTMAEKLRAVHDQVKIIFITGMTEHIGAGYRLEASDYLIKPIKKEQLFAVLKRILASVPQEERYLILSTEEGQVKIAVDSVICAEVSGRELTLTTTTGTHQLRWTMQELKNQLQDEAFVVPDRSWLVHCGHMERVGKNDILMDNGISVPVSRRNAKAVTQAFIEYYRR